MTKLETRELCKAYRGRKVVDDVSVIVEQGGGVGVLGLQTVSHNKGYMLSGGERRRVEIARSLAINPKFLLLDEPFSGIDPIQVLELQRIIFELKRSGIGILMTDHNVRETLMVTDRAYIINNGKIIRSRRPDVPLRHPDTIRAHRTSNSPFL